MLNLVWVIPALLILIQISISLTYPWVNKRHRYFERLGALGFMEDEQGAICRYKAPAPEVLLSPVSEEGNPGLTRIASNLLLANSIRCLYLFFKYKSRMRYQKRHYSREQMQLLEAVAMSEDFRPYLQDAFEQAFTNA